MGKRIFPFYDKLNETEKDSIGYNKTEFLRKANNVVSDGRNSFTKRSTPLEYNTKLNTYLNANNFTLLDFFEPFISENKINNTIDNTLYFIYVYDGNIFQFKLYAFYTDIIGEINHNELSSLYQAGVNYSIDSKLNFYNAGNFIAVTDGVNTPHRIEVNKNGEIISGIFGKKSPRLIPDVFYGVDTDFYYDVNSTDKVGTGIEYGSRVAIVYTYRDKYGEESNPSPIGINPITFNPSFDDDGKLIDFDTITHFPVTSDNAEYNEVKVGFKRYISKILVGNVALPHDLSDDAREEAETFVFYISSNPYAEFNYAFGDFYKIDEKLINNKNSINKYEINIPIGVVTNKVSYKNDIAPIAKNICQIEDITVLSNLQIEFKTNFDFDSIVPIKIDLNDTPLIDNYLCIRLTKDKLKEFFELGSYLKINSYDIIFSDTNINKIRFLANDRQTPLPCCYYVKQSTATPSSLEDLEYIDFYLKIPYIEPYGQSNIYFCFGVNDIDLTNISENEYYTYGKFLDVNASCFEDLQKVFKLNFVRHFYDLVVTNNTFYTYRLDNLANRNLLARTPQEDFVLTSNTKKIIYAQLRPDKAVKIKEPRVINLAGDEDWLKFDTHEDLKNTTESPNGLYLSMIFNIDKITDTQEVELFRYNNYEWSNTNFAKIFFKRGISEYSLRIRFSQSGLSNSDGDINLRSDYIVSLKPISMIDDTGIVEVFVSWTQALAPERNRVFGFIRQKKFDLTNVVENYNEISFPNVPVPADWQYTLRTNRGAIYVCRDTSQINTSNMYVSQFQMGKEYINDPYRADAYLRFGADTVEEVGTGYRVIAIDANTSVSFTSTKVIFGFLGEQVAIDSYLNELKAGDVISFTHTINNNKEFVLTTDPLRVGSQIDITASGFTIETMPIGNPFNVYHNFINKNIIIEDKQSKIDKSFSNYFTWSNKNSRSFPEANLLSIPEDIQLSVPSGSYLGFAEKKIVVNFGKNLTRAFVFSGEQAVSAGELTIPEKDFGLIANKSLQNLGDLIIYASERGLILRSGNNFELLTNNINFDARDDYVSMFIQNGNNSDYIVGYYDNKIKLSEFNEPENSFEKIISFEDFSIASKTNEFFILDINGKITASYIDGSSSEMHSASYANGKLFVATDTGLRYFLLPDLSTLTSVSFITSQIAYPKDVVYDDKEDVVYLADYGDGLKKLTPVSPALGSYAVTDIYPPQSLGTTYVNHVLIDENYIYIGVDVISTLSGFCIERIDKSSFTFLSNSGTSYQNIDNTYRLENMLLQNSNLVINAQLVGVASLDKTNFSKEFVYYKNVDKIVISNFILVGYDSKENNVFAININDYIIYKLYDLNDVDSIVFSSLLMFISKPAGDTINSFIYPNNDVNFLGINKNNGVFYRINGNDFKVTGTSKINSSTGTNNINLVKIGNEINYYPTETKTSALVEVEKEINFYSSKLISFSIFGNGDSIVDVTVNDDTVSKQRSKTFSLVKANKRRMFPIGYRGNKLNINVKNINDIKELELSTVEMSSRE